MPLKTSKKNHKMIFFSFLGGMLLVRRVMPNQQPDHPAKSQKCGWRYRQQHT